MEFEKVVALKYKYIKYYSTKQSTTCASKEEFFDWLSNSSKARKIALNYSITRSNKDALCIYRVSINKGYIISNLKISRFSDFKSFSKLCEWSKKTCFLSRYERFRRSKKGILYRYYWARFRDSRITKNKFTSTLIKDKTFLKLYKKYKDSGYLKSLKPRIILKDKSKPKTLNNIMFTTNYNRSKV